MIFENRQEAGKRLATELAQFRDEQPLIVALPRGGIPIGFEIAEILHAHLEVLVARKIGAPYNPEFGIGAIAEGNVRVLDEPIVKLLDISKEELEQANKAQPNVIMSEVDHDPVVPKTGTRDNERVNPRANEASDSTDTNTGGIIAGAAKGANQS